MALQRNVLEEQLTRESRPERQLVVSGDGVGIAEIQPEVEVAVHGGAHGLRPGEGAGFHTTCRRKNSVQRPSYSARTTACGSSAWWQWPQRGTRQNDFAPASAS